MMCRVKTGYAAIEYAQLQQRAAAHDHRNWRAMGVADMLIIAAQVG